VSGLLASVGLIATDALAGQGPVTVRSSGANACVDLTTPAHTVGQRSSSGQLVNYDPTNVLVAGCPVVSDSYDWGGAGNNSSLWYAPAAKQAHMSVWSSAAGGVSVDACRTYFTGSGGTCVFGASAPAAGVYDLSFNPSAAWASGDPRDGYWLKAEVTSNSAIFSYWFGNS